MAMRITSKERGTMPIAIRQNARPPPDTELEFVVFRDQVIVCIPNGGTGGQTRAMSKLPIVEGLGDPRIRLPVSPFSRSPTRV